MKKRIYRVQFNSTSLLVRASNKNTAIRHVVSQNIQADVATQDDLVKLTAAGVEVQEAVSTRAAAK